MTSAVYAYVEDALRRYPANGHVLEAGSYDVNGSIRPLFQDASRFPSYLGLDMREGPGVDLVMNLHDLGVGVTTTAKAGVNRLFGCIVCCEMLEHDDRPWRSMRLMARRLQEGGFLIVTTRSIGFPRHDYPSDYWRFTADGLVALFEYAGLQVVEAVENTEDQGTYGIATL